MDTAAFDERSPLRPALPFALEELEIYGKCPAAMWVLAQYSNGTTTGDRASKFDLNLCDEQGQVCVRVKGFSVKRPEEKTGPAKATVGTVLLHPYWREEAVDRKTAPTVYEQHFTVLCETGQAFRQLIETRMRQVRCLTLKSGDNRIEERFQTYTVLLFEEIRNILKAKPKQKVLIQVVVPFQEEQQLFAGFCGLLKTARLENPKLIGQLIEIEPDQDSESIMEILKENSLRLHDERIRYRGGKRFVADWHEIKSFPDTVQVPWKTQGVYLITGGAGGLGLIFAREIVHKVKDATVILTGRSTPDGDKKARLNELEKTGARVVYRQVDVTRKQSVAGLIRGIREEFGNLDGIIHAAGVTRDNYITQKTRSELKKVLAPKVRGLTYLDQATKDLDLDFFILFSSIAGGLGNAGQADYAAANAFMDAYAGYRNTLAALKQRYGQTLSVNWPLWKEGGMRMDEATAKMIRQGTGMVAMQTPSGIRAFYSGLATGREQILVMKGDLVRIRQKLLSTVTPAAPPSVKTPAVPPVVPTDTITGVDTNTLHEKVESAMLQTVSGLLKVKKEDIDGDTELSDYGFDSIMLTAFAATINQEYKLELTPAIFFEYPTLDGFTKYLLKDHRAVLASHFTVETVDETVRPIEKESVEKITGQRGRSRFVKTAAQFQTKPEPAASEPIAIIGMSGRFPMARDINEFWKNLVEGKDCISEIPKERWDWREYYGDPKKEVNKTNVKWGGFIDGIDQFDPLFFGISPKEAELMDPQQRLMMTHIWKAVEDAGYSAQSLSGTQTAIFVGTGNNGYGQLISRAKATIEGYSSTGIVPSVGPNRMSYFLNLHGPSEPIETACSSSLVAIHRAVSAIQSKSCETAIVGGVSTILSPDLHISFSKAGMLCEDGRCKTFSKQADGYVRGEGVGMLFLKKLTAAKKDKDHIYGIIRGSAENHGGRANSLTAPNPKAQAQLLVSAYTKAGVEPKTVSYIEAHGTGTELGDPIEINGLKTAFKELYQAAKDPKVINAHCGLGSVKSNIGHLELAAGIAGVIKVLLQFKHKTLVKSLHCDSINPYIRLKESPFYIVQEKQEWKSSQDALGKEIPRRAGVSSFGFGGANAHIVMEEYIPKALQQPAITISPDNPAIIVLSARNEERLMEKAQQLLVAIQEEQYADTDLDNIAYTLQVGREQMEERLALLVSSVKELEEKLKCFVEGRDDIEDLYRGQVKRHKDTLAVFAADEDMAKTIYAWVAKRKYNKLLALWVKGLLFDWTTLYGNNRPRRISLPTYPFAKERYWVSVPKSAVNETTESQNFAGVIHPLLQQNTSDLSEQRFSSTFTGQEFFLADHVVKGQRVLPGVAHLEMARAAVAQAALKPEERQTGIRLKNVVWVRPVIVEEEPVNIEIGLYPQDSGEIAYEIYSRSSDNGAPPVVHSRGSAQLSKAVKAPTLDLPSLQSRCNQSFVTADQCYEVFNSMGIDYGPAHRGIEKIYVGSNRA